MQSCYDRQLAGYRRVIEESLGKDRKAMRLFIKIMPVFKHYICTAYGISDIFYGRNNNKTTGTG